MNFYSKNVILFLFLKSTTNTAIAWLMTKVNEGIISRQINTFEHDKRPYHKLSFRCKAMKDEMIKEDRCKQILDASLKKMSALQSDFLFDSSIKDMVEVKDSTIAGAGLGLFAKEDITAGSLVAFYPVHVIGINFEENVRRVSIDASGNCHEQTVLNDSDVSNNDYVQYVPGNRRLMGIDIQQEFQGQSIFLDVDLTRPYTAIWASHRINDGAIVTLNSEDGVVAYYKASRKAKNCVNLPFGPSPILATVTTKHVSKGEELFTTYGCSYWLEALLKGTPEVEETDTTVAIVQEAKNVAMDLLSAMKSAAVSYRVQAIQLEAFFASP